MAIKIIKEAEIQENIKEGISFVNVFGEWCGACKMMAPVLEDISNTTPVFKIDIDQNREFAEKMNITAIPVTYIFKDGELKDSIVGFVPKDHLIQKAEAL